MAKFFFEKGDYQNAFKCYLRGKDYCVNAEQTIEMCINSIILSIESGSWSMIPQYISRVETAMTQLNDNEEKKLVDGKLKIAYGLYYLDIGKKKHAAKKFVSVNSAVGMSFNDVFSPQDIVLYGGILALATYDRSELKDILIDSPDFKDYLEYNPVVQEVMMSFYESRYPSFLKGLDQLSIELSMDIYLCNHLDSLLKIIKEKALCQYIRPFVSVDLVKMSKIFNFQDVLQLEMELVTLIQKKEILGRIDAHQKILFLKESQPLQSALHNVMRVGDEFILQLERKILKLNLSKYPDFVVKAPSSNGKGNKGGTSSSSSSMISAINILG